MWELSPGVLAALVGLGGGIVLGLAARLGEFCTLGALEAATYGNDQRRLRLWGVVLGVAILGTFIAEALGLAAPSQTSTTPLPGTSSPRSWAGLSLAMAWHWPGTAALARWCGLAGAICARW